LPGRIRPSLSDMFARYLSPGSIPKTKPEIKWSPTGMNARVSRLHRQKVNRSMAKRKKKARRVTKKSAQPRSGSRPSDREQGEGASPDEAADPLAMPPWAGGAASPEEAEERARFERVWQDFRQGDFRRCRSGAAALAADAASGEVRRRARALPERMRVDPLALGMAAVALTLLLTAVIWTFA